MSVLEELENAILSDVSSDAVRVWLWLRVVQGGRCPVSRLYDYWPNMINTGIKELRSANLIRFRVTTVETCAFKEHNGSKVRELPIRSKVPISPSPAPTKPRTSSQEDKGVEVRELLPAAPAPPASAPPPCPAPAPVTEEALAPSPAGKARSSPGRSPKFKGLSGREASKLALASPKLKGAKQALAEGCDWVFRRYVEARHRHGVNRPLSGAYQRRNARYWRALLTIVCNDDELRLDDFLSFVYERTRWQKTAFPTPSVCAGKWAIGEWEAEAEEVAAGGAKHAGGSYATATLGTLDVAREVAAAHGHAGLDDEMLQYLVEQAELLNTSPRHYTPDPEFEKAERELARRLAS